MHAPIILFVYNRLEHTKSTIESLQECYGANLSDLIIFSDGPKSFIERDEIEGVREYLGRIDGFKSVSIYTQKQNIGLSKSIIGGVSLALKLHDRVIVLEDDLLLHKSFLDAMNLFLDKYHQDSAIGSVTGYSLPISLPKSYKFGSYFSYRHSSWGWGTWRRVWSEIDWDIKDYNSFSSNKIKVEKFNRGGSDLSLMLKQQVEGRIDSWAIRFNYHMYKRDLLSICPVENLVHNIGHDGSGTHCKAAGYLQKPFECNDNVELHIFPNEKNVNYVIGKKIQGHFSLRFRSKIIRRLKKLFKLKD